MMKWIKFDDEYPPHDGQARLVVWFKGPERQKHLGVSWVDIEAFKHEWHISEQDVLAYWTVLTDPEDQE